MRLKSKCARFLSSVPQAILLPLPVFLLLRHSRPQEVYVYSVPGRTPAGHVASTWKTDQWLKVVRLRLARSGLAYSVKLEDLETGALFAEAPVEDKPLSDILEGTVDSSR